MTQTQQSAAIATLCAVLVVTTQVGGKALRDALFLTAFPVTDLPQMVMGAAVLALVAMLSVSKLLNTWGPRRVTSGLFVVSASLLGAQGLAAAAYPAPVAVTLYLHLAVFGALLISGVWSTVSEAFDPSSARKHIGTVAAGATGGGLLGGVLAERVAAWSGPATMFFVLAGAHLLCSGAVAALRPIEEQPREAASGTIAESLEHVVGDGYLSKLTMLVMLATVLENILDYMLKAEAAAAMDQASLMRFFGVFYTVVGLLTFLMQLGFSRRLLERFGPARTAGLLPAAGMIGALGMLFVPGLGLAIASRGAYALARNSVFRSGYELFFAPLSAARKRSAKTLIDVGADRGADLIGGLIIAGILLIIPDDPGWLMCAVAAMAAGGLILMTRELERGYVETLESELIDRGGELAMTQTLMRSGILAQSFAGFGAVVGADSASPIDEAAPQPEVDENLHAWLDEPLDDERAREAIALLADDDHAARAAEALLRGGDAHNELLFAELRDGQASFEVRRRIPQILSRQPAAIVAPALLDGLKDRRFDVRFRCGAVLFALRKNGGDVAVEAARILEILESEVSVGRRLWKARRLLDAEPEGADALDEMLGDRVDRSLQHVFHLLGLIHPARPLRVAFKGLHTGDAMLRGTALEYLTTILPPRLYSRLTQVMGEEPDRRPSNRSVDDALESLLASQASIEVELRHLLDARKRTEPL